MRSAVHASFGEPADVIGPADSPMPQPGPGEVRVRMTLAPIHNHDLWTIRGQYGWKPSLPAIGGSEACGVVDALGEGVEGLRVGQRVNTAAGRGTWAEYFVTPAGMAIPLPDAIPDEVAAQLVAMPLSALMLLEFLDVQPGQWIVQNAANGAVGKTLAMLAERLQNQNFHQAIAVRFLPAIQGPAHESHKNRSCWYLHWSPEAKTV